MMNKGGYYTQNSQRITKENAVAPHIGTSNYIPNEEWQLLGSLGLRNEVSYVCCPNNYTLLEYTLYLRRRPMFYLVNLVIPTFIITMIAIIGFFTTSSTTGIREEKISLCITTLLSMSILMLMVSDQMPSTSAFIPLLSWFYMCAIIIISLGALAASFVISVQKFGRAGQRLPRRAAKICRLVSTFTMVNIPSHLKPRDKLIQNNKNKSMDERRSTIAQFARYIFTAGPEVQAYPFIDNNTSNVNRNCCSMGTEPLVSYLGKPLYQQSEKQTQGLKRKAERKRGMSEQSQEEQSNSHEPLSSRYMAKIEYDWVATVIERCVFLIFLLSFLALSLGINLLGWIHWLNSVPPPESTLPIDN